MNDEAIKVLELAPVYPTVYYWLAYLYRNTSKQKSEEYLNKAEAISPWLVFPFRTETMPVLEWAWEQRHSWKTVYYSALIQWNNNNLMKAKELFEKCGNEPDYAPFYISRGILFSDDKTKQDDVQKDFKRAILIDPKEWRTWNSLSSFYEKNGSFSEQFDNAKKANQIFSSNPVIGIDYAKALINSGNFRECIKVLDRVNILPQEGAREGHDIYELANLSMAVELLEREKYREALKYVNNSKNWPENLGAGKPYEPDIRFQDYISAYCYTQLRDQKQADNYSDQIINYSLEHWGPAGEPANIYIANQVFNDHGKHHEAILTMENWKTEQDSLRDWKISPGSSAPKAQWVLAKYRREEEKAEKLEKEISSVSTENRFRLFLKTMSIINMKKNE
jgi:tetratricopeptide (TPR) repeat protein